MHRMLPPALGGLLIACTPAAPDPLDRLPEGPLPDFALLDVNPTSATADTLVRPRDHLGVISAWYFGNAT